MGTEKVIHRTEDGQRSRQKETDKEISREEEANRTRDEERR